MLQEILEQQCGYEVVEAANGQIALEHLRNENNKFDLVLLDLMMPVMDGFEVMTRMREDDRLKEMPVVVMSSAESSETISSCLKLGAKDFFVKPVKKSHAMALVDYMKQDNKPIGADEEKGFARFQVLRFLGKGQCGSVNLVRKKSTNE